MIFSPSATSRHLTCPMLQALHADGWRPRLLGKRDLAALLGQAMAEGCAVYHRALQTGREAIVENVVETALTHIRATRATWETQGFRLRDEDAPTAELLEARVTKGLQRYMAVAPTVAQGWQIVDVEYEIPDSGRSRIDLGVMTPMGLAVADNKWKLTLDARYRPKTLEAWRTDWQQRHYAHFYGAAKGEAIREYYIILGVLEPKFSVEVVPYTLHPEDMLAWEHSRAQVHGDMSDPERVPYQNLTQCLSNFGPCEMYRACHVHHYDEGLMRSDYLNVKETV